MYEIYAKLKAEKGVTDYQISKSTGITRSTFSEWKRGKYIPKSEKLKKIADFFGVSLEYLTTGKDAEKESAEGTKYYFDNATAEMAQKLYENRDMRILFDAAHNMSPEDLQMATDLLNRLKSYRDALRNANYNAESEGPHVDDD